MKLWLVRHADASAQRVGERDFDRPLSAIGSEHVARLARWLATHPHRPERVISSDAARARATASLAISRFDPMAVSLELDRRLYDASLETIVDVVRETPASCSNLAIVAHNPGISHAASALAADARSVSLPPLGVVLLDFTDSWCSVRLHCGAMLSTTHPGGDTW